MFKKQGFLLVCLLMCCTNVTYAQLKIGKKLFDTTKALQALSDVTSAMTLTDADIARMSKESVDWMDANSPVDTGEYDARLKRLTAGITSVDGLTLNFKVYRVADINAFACGDGSIRVFSSLMDIMDDDELISIIGHEIGHVVHHDTKDAMKNAYLASAARNAAGVAGGVLGKISESEWADVATAFMDAKFSQKQEYAADEYGFEFAVKHGFSPYGMANGLSKLVELSQGEKASAIQKMFSSHPDSEKRAAKMREKANSYVANRK